MGKTRMKNHSEVEHLRGENKKLKSQIRSLQREIKQLQKRSHFFEEVVDEEIEDVSLVTTCENCGKGTLTLLDLSYVKFLKCDLCDFREKVNNGKEAKNKKET